ncbi:unnamed protein product [Staurois parvus]|uniref:Uncharacterized protein n=1 Tax=Staurois parvus TaxID=386267 RepID=A0ABN9B6P1_9NEOB|nr:unnamed protein product [Staurois parvus]
MKKLCSSSKNAEAQIQESSKSEDADVKRTVMYGNFAWVFFHQNQFIKSLTYAKKVRTILKQYESPPRKQTLLLDIYGEQGWTYLSFTGKYYQRAAECFEKALELDPEDPESNSGLPWLCIEWKVSDTVATQKTNERAVNLNPSDTVVKVLLALKYLYMKNHDQGAMLIEQALQEQPESPYVLRYVATFYKRRGQIDNAIAIFKKILTLTPTSCAVYYQLGTCFKQLIRMPKALKGQSTHDNRQQNAEAIANAIFYSEKAVELNRSSVAAHNLLINVYMKTNEYQKAKEVFGKALTIKSMRCEEKQELHLSWAQYLMNSRKSESEAVRHFKEVIKIQSETWFRGTAIKKLQSLAETMIVQNAMDATGHALLGYIHQQRGQDIAALEYYEKALLLDPDNQEYLEACSALQATLS